MENHNEIPTGALIGAIRKKLWILLVSAALCAGILMAAAALQPMRYGAHLVFYIDNCGTDEEISASDITAARSLVDSCRTILELSSFRDAVAEMAGASDFDLEGEALNETEFLKITVIAPTAESGRRVAEAVGIVFPQQANRTLASADIRLADPPKMPKTVVPDYGFLGGLGAAVGLFISIAGVAAAEYSRLQKIKDEELSHLHLSQ